MGVKVRKHERARRRRRRSLSLDAVNLAKSLIHDYLDFLEDIFDHGEINDVEMVDRLHTALELANFLDLPFVAGRIRRMIKKYSGGYL